MLDTKIHVNSVILDASRGARYLCMDISNYYLGSPMDSHYQYMRIQHQRNIPQEIIGEYNITFDEHGYAYIEIRRGMYGLKEAGILPFNQLVKKLAPLATFQSTKHPDSGHTHPGPPPSPYAWTTSASNFSTKPTPTTSSMPSNPHMPPPSTGPAPYTAV
jgi:hypothetical protein